MKNLLLVLFVLSIGKLIAQDPNEAKFPINNYQITIDDFLPADFEVDPLKVDFRNTLNSEAPFTSEFTMLLPHQYNMNNYPMNDLSRMDDLMMGFSISQNFPVGTTKFKSQYVYDMMGNLVDYQFSIQFGKKK